MISNIGVPGLILVLNIFLLFVGLFFLYIVILTAVREGINKSVVGLFIKKKYGINEDKDQRSSFLDSDLDNNK